MSEHNQVNNTQQDAELLDQYLDRFNADPLTPAPEKLGPEIAQFVRSVKDTQASVPNRSKQAYIWQQALNGAAARPRKRWMQWALGGIPFALAGATVLVFIVLGFVGERAKGPGIAAQAVTSTVDLPALIPSMVVATNTPTMTPTISAKAPTLTSYQGVFTSRFDSNGLTSEIGATPIFQMHMWYAAPNRYRYERYYGAYNSTINNRDKEPAVATAMHMAAQSTAIPLKAGPEQILFDIDVNDGSRRWDYSPSTESVRQRREDDETDYNIGVLHYNVSATGDAGLQALIKLLELRNTSVKLLRTEMFINRPSYVLEMTPKFPDLINITHRVVFWVDQEYYLVLKGESYDQKDILVGRSELLNITINQPIDPAIFKLNLPASTWNNGSQFQVSTVGNGTKYELDALQFDWHIDAGRISYPLYLPDPALFDKNHLVFGYLNYDPFSHVVTQQAYLSSDPYGASVFTLAEKPMIANGPLVDPAGGWPSHPVKVGQLTGTYWEGMNSSGMKLSGLGLVKDNTEIVLQATAASGLTSQNIVDIAASLRYFAPHWGTNEINPVWQQIAHYANAPVYAVHDPSNGAVYMDGYEYEPIRNLAAGKPDINLANGFITQPFYSDAQPGIALLLTEGQRLPALTYSVSAQTVRVAFNTDATYYEQDGYRWLIFNWQGTPITLQARSDLVSQADLLTIGSSLQVVQPLTVGNTPTP